MGNERQESRGDQGGERARRLRSVRGGARPGPPCDRSGGRAGRGDLRIVHRVHGRSAHVDLAFHAQQSPRCDDPGLRAEVQHGLLGLSYRLARVERLRPALQGPRVPAGQRTRLTDLAESLLHPARLPHHPGVADGPGHQPGHLGRPGRRDHPQHVGLRHRGGRLPDAGDPVQGRHFRLRPDLRERCRSGDRNRLRPTR